MKVLHINSSPRGANSQSISIAEKLIAEIKAQNPSDVEVDRYDLLEDELPAFGKLAVGAKMALFTGAESSHEEQAAWAAIKAVFERFAAADVYVFSVPLWNHGIPYILKQFIDVVTQPGWTFGFDPTTGYSGLLSGKKAFVIHASGVFHEGIIDNFGSDFSTPYVKEWLNFIGVDDVEQIHVAPTVVNADFAKTKAEAETLAVEKAKTAMRA